MFSKNIMAYNDPPEGTTNDDDGNPIGQGDSKEDSSSGESSAPNIEDK